MDQTRHFAAPGQNRLLSCLPRDAQLRLLPRLEKVPLTVRQVLYEQGAPLAYVWLPLSGVTSLILSMNDGVSVEVGTIGNEGLVGVPAFLGAERSPLRTVCQVAGQALRMRVDAFHRTLVEQPLFHEVVRRYAQALFNQVTQTTACNQLHSVHERMCRWLLMTHDRVGAEEFYLTQEFLAQMLGVRRPSVTVAAGLLQKSGLIRYQRGRIRIVDRAGLEKGACECYETARQEFDRSLPLAMTVAPAGA